MVMLVVSDPGTFLFFDISFAYILTAFMLFISTMPFHGHGDVFPLCRAWCETLSYQNTLR